MFIFRVEHDRNLCNDSFFGKGGESLTGHGTFKVTCTNRPEPVSFGLVGMPPRSIMMVHERIAVTAEQFRNWIGETTLCRFTTPQCEGDRYCNECLSTREFYLPKGWVLVAYWVEDDSEDIDWREDQGQIVFNPSFAECVGPIKEWEMEQFAGELIGNCPWY